MRVDYSNGVGGGLHGAQLSGNVGNRVDPRDFRPTVRVRAIMFI